MDREEINNILKNPDLYFFTIIQDNEMEVNEIITSIENRYYYLSDIDKIINDVKEKKKLVDELIEKIVELNINMLNSLPWNNDEYNKEEQELIEFYLLYIKESIEERYSMLLEMAEKVEEIIINKIALTN